jgi:hypothetical protein
MRIRSPRDKRLRRRRRSSASDATRRPWAPCVNHRHIADHLARHDAAVRWPVRVMGAIDGLRECHPGSACQPHPNAARPGLASRCGQWPPQPCPAPRCPPAGCRCLASVWRGLGRASRAASPASPSTKRLRFGRHRVAALPHHCRPQGVPRPPCPAPGRPHPRQGAGTVRRTPRAAGARACPTPRSRPHAASAPR